MTAHRPAAPPTLTEVIDLPDSAMAPTEPMPLAPDSMTLEELEVHRAPPPAEARPMRLADLDAAWRARVIDDLRPMLEGWLEVELRRALAQAMPALADRLLGILRQRLEEDLPAMVERSPTARRRPDLGEG